MDGGGKGEKEADDLIKGRRDKGFEITFVIKY